MKFSHVVAALLRSALKPLQMYSTVSGKCCMRTGNDYYIHSMLEIVIQASLWHTNFIHEHVPVPLILAKTRLSYSCLPSHIHQNLIHQNLPHPLVCCMQVGTRFLLNICTVDTSQHLCHHNFLSKVLPIHDYPIVVVILCQLKISNNHNLP